MQREDRREVVARRRDGDRAGSAEGRGCGQIDRVAGEGDVAGAAGDATAIAQGAAEVQAPAGIVGVHAGQADCATGSKSFEVASVETEVTRCCGGTADADAARASGNQRGGALVAGSRRREGGHARDRDGGRGIAARLQHGTDCRPVVVQFNAVAGGTLSVQRDDTGTCVDDLAARCTGVPGNAWRSIGRFAFDGDVTAAAVHLDVVGISGVVGVPDPRTQLHAAGRERAPGRSAVGEGIARGQAATAGSTASQGDGAAAGALVGQAIGRIEHHARLEADVVTVGTGRPVRIRPEGDIAVVGLKSQRGVGFDAARRLEEQGRIGRRHGDTSAQPDIATIEADWACHSQRIAQGQVEVVGALTEGKSTERGAKVPVVVKAQGSAVTRAQMGEAAAGRLDGQGAVGLDADAA